MGQNESGCCSSWHNLHRTDISQLGKRRSIFNLPIDDEPVILQLNEVEISSEDIPGWMVANKGQSDGALDVTVTPELEAGRKCKGICKPDSEDPERQWV